jgi:hypothetical protein
MGEVIRWDNRITTPQLLFVRGDACVISIMPPLYNIRRATLEDRFRNMWSAVEAVAKRWDTDRRAAALSARSATDGFVAGVVGMLKFLNGMSRGRDGVESLVKLNKHSVALYAGLNSLVSPACSNVRADKEYDRLVGMLGDMEWYLADLPHVLDP